MKKTHPDLRKLINECAMDVKESLLEDDYLESNYRNLLARSLRSIGLDVYEEVPLTFILENDKIPFGYGFLDIVIHDRETGGSIILELKITSKNPKRQLTKYMKHFKYTPVLFGVTINFYKDDIDIEFYELQ